MFPIYEALYHSDLMRFEKYSDCLFSSAMGAIPYRRTMDEKRTQLTLDQHLVCRSECHWPLLSSMYTTDKEAEDPLR